MPPAPTVWGKWDKMHLGVPEVRIDKNKIYKLGIPPPAIEQKKRALYRSALFLYRYSITYMLRVTQTLKLRVWPSASARGS